VVGDNSVVTEENQPQAAQPGYPQAPGVPGFPAYVLPDHPKSTTALVLGLVAILGGFTCLVPIFVAPFAWVVGAQARKEIRQAPYQWGGEGRATGGMVLGIIGTAMIAIGLIAIFLIIVVIALSNSGGGSGSVSTRV
jgi:hypothetical protein